MAGGGEEMALPMLSATSPRRRVAGVLGRYRGALADMRRWLATGPAGSGTYASPGVLAVSQPGPGTTGVRHQPGLRGGCRASVCRVRGGLPAADRRQLRVGAVSGSGASRREVRGLALGAVGAQAAGAVRVHVR